MNKEKSKNINWLTAFKIILTGNKETLGKNYKIKNGLLIVAMTWFIASPFITIKLSEPFQGEIPPATPLIKGFGTLNYGVSKQGLKEFSYIEYHLNHGEIYKSWDNIGMGGLYESKKFELPIRVYAEGFLLKNGKGSFWPLEITTLDGHELINREKSFSTLLEQRKFFSKTLLYMYITGLPFLIASLFNIIEIRNKTYKEN